MPTVTITQITANYRNERRVIVNEVNFPVAEIRAEVFDNALDDAAWYHGFWTNVENLTEVKAHFADGMIVNLGRPARV